MIRAARPEDAAPIAALLNPVIRDTTITFNSIEKTSEDVALDIEAAPVFLVAERDGIEGFASARQFRAGVGYARAFEHSIVINPDARGTGVGRALMAELEAELRLRDVGSLWAGVSAENPDGVRFHRRMGFAEVATLPRVGWKFGRWLDLTLMVKRLDEDRDAAPRND